MEFFQIVGEKLGFGIYTNLNWEIWPGLESFQIVEEKLGFGIYTNLNWGIWPELESFQTVREKLGFGIYTNLNWGIWLSLESFQTVGEKLGFGIYTNLNWGESNSVWSISKQSGKNWDLGFTQISIGGNLTQFGVFPNNRGKIGIWDLHKSQLGGNQTWFGIFPNSRGKIGIWDLHKSQLRGIWPDLESFQTVGEKLGFGIYTNLNWGGGGNLTRFGVFPNSWEKIGIWNLHKSQLRNLTRFGVIPNSRGKMVDWFFWISIEWILIIGFFSLECEFYLLL